MALIGAFAGLGKGLADIGSLYAKDEAKERDIEARRALQEERLLAQQERVAARSERTAAAGSGIDKDKLAEYEALSLGTTVPEGQAVAKALRTGDLSPFATPEAAVTGNNPSAYVAPSGNMELTEATRTLLKQKNEVLRQITKQAAFGKEYEQIEKGERAALVNTAGRGIIAGELSDPEKLLAIEGKPLFAGNASGVTNRATGEQELTDLGKAQATKAARAPAGKAPGRDFTEAEANARATRLGVELDNARQRLEKNRYNMKPAEIAETEARIAAYQRELDGTLRITKPAAGGGAPAAAAAAPRRFGPITREPS